MSEAKYKIHRKIKVPSEYLTVSQFRAVLGKVPDEATVRVEGGFWSASTVVIEWDDKL